MTRGRTMLISIGAVVLLIGGGFLWWYASSFLSPSWVRSICPVQSAIRDTRIILTVNPSDQEGASFRLESLGHDDELAVVFALAKDSDEKIRLFSVVALLRFLRHPGGFALIETLAKDDPSELVRGTALRLVERKKEDDAIKAAAQESLPAPGLHQHDHHHGHHH